MIPKCENCGERRWVQVAKDGSRFAVRALNFKGANVQFAGWRRAGKDEDYSDETSVVCGKCKAVAPSDLVEWLRDTDGFEERPLAFVPPDEVDLDDCIAILKKVYGKSVLATLLSDKRRPAKTKPLSVLHKLHSATCDAIKRKLGTPEPRLYHHQIRAIEHSHSGGNVILATATASGKSLCFQVAVLDGICHAANSERPTALYIAPLNALIDDQFRSLVAFGTPKHKRPEPGGAEALGFLARVALDDSRVATIAQYHGGVVVEPDDENHSGTRNLRREIKAAKPNLVLTNPEMLSAGLLPLAIDIDVPGAGPKKGAGKWTYLFERLRYVIVDECHEYRGVYGSHLANLLRRLRRVCALCGNHDALRYVLCSATIRDPGIFAERLTGATDWLVIDRDADTSERYDSRLVFLEKKEPKQPLQEFAKGVLSVLFARERLSTIYFQESIPAVQALGVRFREVLAGHNLPKDIFEVFAATFLPDEKVERLDRLRAGLSKGVASTSALALGLDIGSLTCVVLGGYPGGLAKTWQMLGRAGRRGPGLQVFLVGETFMDQYWAESPKELLEQKRHLEEIVIAPDNHEILKRHIIAGNYDYPLQPARDRAFFGSEFDSVLDEVLSSNGLSWNEEDSHFLVFTDYNANEVFRIPLRSTSRFKVPAFLGSLGGKKVLVEDEVRALRTLYPGSIFVHDGRFYKVVRLQYEQMPGQQSDRYYAVVNEVGDAHVSIPVVVTNIAATPSDSPGHSGLVGPVTVKFGRVSVTTQVDQFYVVKFDPSRPAERAILVGGDAVGQLKTAPDVQLCKVQHDPGTPHKHEYHSEGTWLCVPEAAMQGLTGEDRYRALFTVGKALVRAIPPYHYASSDDLVFTAFESHKAADGEGAIFIYERNAPGVGLALATLEKINDLAHSALAEVLEGCSRCANDPTSTGCIRCVADPSGFHDRRLGIRLLTAWLETTRPPTTCVRRSKVKGQSSPAKPSKARATKPTGMSPTPQMAAEAALQKLGYTMLEEIGRGGMGYVYRGSRDGQTFALKVALTESDKRGITELHQEGVRQKRVADQNPSAAILRVLEVEKAGDVIVIRMELADGNLRSLLRPQGYCPQGAARMSPVDRVRRTIEDLLPVVDALALLHHHRWVHRDIKPENIAIVDGQLKLGDFGLVRRHFEDGDNQTLGCGTPGYSPPWSFETNVGPDVRDDVYSMGVVLAEMLTGRRPSPDGLGARPAGIPPALHKLITKAMSSRTTRDRFTDAGELAAALRKINGRNS